MLGRRPQEGFPCSHRLPSLAWVRIIHEERFGKNKGYVIVVCDLLSTVSANQEGAILWSLASRDQLHDVFHGQNPVDHSRHHRARYPQRLMDTAAIVIHKMQRDPPAFPFAGPAQTGYPRRMDETLHRALLPQGLRDLLPPEAAWEAEVVGRLTGVLASHGYERVKPPLVEFEDNLLSGAGAAMAMETFRLMDPVSQRMIGQRADMTPQIARIAATRLKDAPRPLRLCYAGQALRVRGSGIRPERQVGQVGAELIGTDAVAADLEAVAVAAEALGALDLKGLSVDLTLPTLVPIVAGALGLDARMLAAVRGSIDHKDAAA